MVSFIVNLSPEYSPVVKKGDSIKPSQTLARILPDQGPTTEAIALHKLLEVNSKNIEKYLIKADGDVVTKGEVIAQNRSFFSSIRVKSPTSGVLRISKNHKGFIRIQPNRQETIKSPVKGRVEDITEKFGIIIETEAVVITGLEGEGNIKGRLTKIENGGNIFSIDRKVEGKIVMGEDFDEAAIVKIKTLGGLGLIVTSKFDINNIPYIVVKRTKYLDEYIGKKVEIVNAGKGHYLVVV